MKVTIKGWNKDPGEFGREAEEIELIIDVGPDTVTLMIEEEKIIVSHVDFEALQRVIYE